MSTAMYFVGAGLSKGIAQRRHPIPIMNDFVRILARHVDRVPILVALGVLVRYRLLEGPSDELKSLADRLLDDEGARTSQQLSRFTALIDALPPQNIETILASLDAQDIQAKWSFRYAINDFFAHLGWNARLRCLKRFISSQTPTASKHIVVSFNYDLLIEFALASAVGWNASLGYGFTFQYFITPEESERAQAAWASGASSAGVAQVGELTSSISSDQRWLVLKPHGSLNWVAWGNDSSRPVLVASSSSGTLAYSRSSLQCPIDVPGVYGAPQLGWLHIVAPETPKQGVREDLVAQEDQALVDADDVYVIGWSIPESDTDQIELIRGAVQRRAHPPKRLVIVNMHASRYYYERVSELFGLRARECEIFDRGWMDFCHRTICNRTSPHDEVVR